MSYNYWNNFVENWGVLPQVEYINPNPIAPFHSILNWINPNLSPLMNSDQLADYSLKYIPEPWWGNNGCHVLNSVVINYNPGRGGLIQVVDHAAELFGNVNYQTLVNNESIGESSYFEATNNWHRTRRAARVFESLGRIEVDLNGFTMLENHLSLELIPWHTTDTSAIGLYINANLQSIFDNIIVFAANESLRIQNEKLRNKVILRLSGHNTMTLLNNFVQHEVCAFVLTEQIGQTPSENGSFLKFKINSIPDVEFISIWGRKSRNDFPPNEDLDFIFRNII